MDAHPWPLARGSAAARELRKLALRYGCVELRDAVAEAGHGVGDARLAAGHREVARVAAPLLARLVGEAASPDAWADAAIVAAHLAAINGRLARHERG